MLKWLALAFVLSAPIVGCADEIDRHIDCNQICSKYKECFGGDSYDADACADRCEDNAAADANYDQKTDLCENCLDDRTCTSSAFACTGECAGVVP